MEPGLFFFLAVFVVLTLFGFGAVQAKKRRDAMAAWAQLLGWSFDPSKTHGFHKQFPAFKALHQGSGRYAYNICQGTFEGRHVMVFDYHYETHSTDSKGKRTTHHHRFSAAIIRANIPLKPLTIRPEGMFDKLAGAFGFDDIDFESAEFSRKFHVKAPDRRWAFDVLHTRAIEHLLALPAKYTIQMDHEQVFLSQGSRSWQPQEFEQAVHALDGLLDLIPDYVRQQQLQQG